MLKQLLPDNITLENKNYSRLILDRDILSIEEFQLLIKKEPNHDKIYIRVGGYVILVVAGSEEISDYAELCVYKEV